ncbi:unnamed protein product [Macrosiphum euphorbiae]|uniref:Trafficking protein particle complex subunit n=1 Tax=Macrosiphum euphorbiae TaxID=13131 RepID=A0AAV0XBB7_9HEMI|nr:unnamed protein product [Macrosiphum euphorbiae]
MTVYSILIVDRVGTILYRKQWNQSGISSEEWAKLMYGMLFPVKTFESTISPLDPNFNFLCSNTGNYAIHYYESESGAKFVLNTDNTVQNIRDLLQKLYAEIYVEYVVKNTECEMGRPIESELFKLKLDQFIKEHFMKSVQ